MDRFIKNVYFLIILIFSGRATVFYQSQEGIIFIFLLTVILWFYFHKPIGKSYGIVVGVWLIYCAMVFLRNGEFTPFFYFRYLTYITVAYLLVNLFREHLFLKFEKTVYVLAFISLFFYTWQVVSTESLFQFARMLDVSGEMGRRSEEYRNFLIYTIENHGRDYLNRNYGFVFEPGSYSVYLSLAMLFNLLRTKINLKPKGNLPLYILGLALITTYSTTGYAALGLLVVYLAFRDIKGWSKYVYLLVGITVVVYFYFKLDFMHNKIEELYVQGQDIEEVIDRAAKSGSSYSGGRFGGFIIGWNDFIQFPLLGRGGVTILSSGMVGQGKVYIVNGLANIMSQFGLFGLVVFFYFLYKSSVQLAHYFQSKALYAFFIVIMVGMTAFSIHYHYILFTIMFYSLYSIKGTFYYKTQNKSLKERNENTFIYRIPSFRR